MNDTTRELLALIQNTYDIDPATIDPNRPLADFGLDSLALAELLFAVEDRFHIEIPDSRVNVHTLAELAVVVDSIRSTVAAT